MVAVIQARLSARPGRWWLWSARIYNDDKAIAVAHVEGAIYYRSKRNAKDAAKEILTDLLIEIVE